jgi:hypothetical protein
MKLTNVRSADLPEISEAVKECVNRGQWLLFKSSSISNAGSHAPFYLKVDTQIFELDTLGKILSSHPREGLNVQIDELCYFSDLPKPRSLSNMAIV